MSSQYYLNLPTVERQRYLQKLCFSLPDPFNGTLRRQYFSTDLSDLPDVSQMNIFEYLVERECFYTREAFKAYRSLDAYNYYYSGKVRAILTYKAGETCVVYGEVQSSQRLEKYYSAWVVADKFGNIQSGHCTCMAG